jgi:thiamine pyrophosphate-dependent acetolactate synthase large subunit-like protein
MDAGELATLVQEDLDVTVLVVEDGGHDLLRDGSFGLEPSGADQPLQSDLIGPDWLAVAAAYGIPAEEVSDPGPALRDALERAVVATGPRFVLLRYGFAPPRNGSPIG